MDGLVVVVCDLSVCFQCSGDRYVEQFYQVWDEYFWMTPEKGQLITPTPICWEQKEQKVGFGDHPLDLKEPKYMGYLSPEQCKQTFKVTYHPNQ